MSKDKTSISKASSYKEISEFWSKHDLADFWEQTEPVDFEVEIESEKIYYPLDRDLSVKLDRIAHRRGISKATLLNLWIQEKIGQQLAG